MSKPTTAAITIPAGTAEQQLAALKQAEENIKEQAGAEIAKQIADVKQTLKKLQDKYEEVTGKPATPASAKAETGKRTRTPSEEINQLAGAITVLLKASSTGMSISQITEETSYPVSTVRLALKKVKDLKKTGEKTNMVYKVD